MTDPAGVLDRLPGAGLVGDRADAADARGDVGDLGVLPAPQERLEEARRLVDLQLARATAVVVDDDAQRALALDPGERADLQRSRVGSSVRRSFGEVRDATLNVEKTRSTVRSLIPHAAQLTDQRGQVGAAHRAEAAVAAAIAPPGTAHRSRRG